MNNINKSRKVFCLAPWVHTHINPFGQRALCCESDQIYGFEESTLEEYWNSNILKKIRLDMINNTPPEKCHFCHGKDNPRALEFDEYEDAESLLLETDKDGYFKKMPIYYDYRISNACSLSCRMCNPESSSKIEKLHNKLNKTSSYSDPQQRNKHKPLTELKNAVLNGELQRTYWAFGEAFIQKEHWEFIDYCIQLKKFEINLTYHTNLSFTQNSLRSYFSKLSLFKNIELIISIDGVSETGEMIRDGLSWNNFVNNLNYIISNYPSYKVSFNITLTIPTLLNLKSLISFLKHYNLHYTVNLCNPAGTSLIYSPVALDRNTFEVILKNSKITIEQFNQSSLTSPFTDRIDQLIKAREESNYNEEEIKVIARRLHECDELDRIAERELTSNYYKKNILTKKWVENLESQYSNKAIFNDDTSFWESIHHRSDSMNHRVHPLSFPKKKELILFLNEKLLSEKEVKISIITSNPSIVSKLLFKNNSSKFLYNNFVPEIEKETSFKVLEVNYIGVFKFLFRNKKKLKSISIALDLMLSPIKKWTSFHCQYILSPKFFEDK